MYFEIQCLFHIYSASQFKASQLRQVFKDTAVIKQMYYSYLIYKMNFFP